MRSWPGRQLLAQAVFDNLQLQRRTFVGRIGLARVVWRARRLLAKHGDPEVTYALDGQQLRIPLSHELPFHLAWHPSYGRSVGRIAAEVAKQYSDLTFIDIGANVGDTVVFLRSHMHFPILCVEGDPKFARLLRKNVGLLPDIEIAEMFLDEITGVISAVATSAGGTARITPEPQGTPMAVASLTDLVDGHPLFADPRMIKIDTDGMDGRILSGGIDLIARARPVLFFEYDPYLASRAGVDLRGVMTGLADIGYRRVMVYENTGDYLYSLDLLDPDNTEDLHERYSGWQGTKYADLCAFHDRDEGLWRTIRQSEIAHFGNARGVAQGNER